MYTIIYSKENQKVKNYVNFFNENKIPYVEKKVDLISYNDFLTILSNTEDGIDEILSVRSKVYANLKNEGVELEDLTLGEVYELLLQKPALLRLPIVFNKSKLAVGFNETEIGLLLPRETKRKSFETTLVFMEKLFPYDETMSMESI